jgi:hypothetical protein
MVSLIVTAYGEPGNPYSRYVRRWWDAVVALELPPSEVVVVHTDPEPLGVLAAAPPGIRVKAVPMPAGLDFSAYWNAGCQAASGPWLTSTGIDDCYTPDAFADLEAADRQGADILCWHHQERGGHVWKGFWCPRTLRQANTIPGSSPYRRSLWQRVGGAPAMGWSDWGFWLLAARSEARAYQSDRVGVIWDPGHEHPTWSGPALPADVKAARDREIQEMVNTLWP